LSAPQDLITMPESTDLYQAFFESPDGLCGKQDAANDLGKIVGLEPRLHLITLGCILDATPRQERWKELLPLEDHWLADSSQVAYKRSQEVEQAFRENRVRAPKHTARVWWQICRGVQGRYKGSLRGLLDANQKNALRIQQYLEESTTSFPVLSAPITSARWLDMVHRVGQVRLVDWRELRLSLPESLKELAGLFDLDRELLHPALSLALQVWSGGCEQRDGDHCGLEDCPRR